MAPLVEFLWWAECPSWQRALAELRGEMAAAGIPAEALVVTEVRDEEEAVRLGFPGSPTIRVGGRDVQPPPPEVPIGLTCRVYRRADGRVSPLPDRAEVRRVLSATKGEERGASS